MNKSKKTMKQIYRLLLVFLITYTLNSCCQNAETPNAIVGANGVIIEKIQKPLIYPVKEQVIMRSGMKLLVLSGTYGEAGVDIINLTLDSLKIEYYKQILNDTPYNMKY